MIRPPFSCIAKSPKGDFARSGTPHPSRHLRWCDTSPTTVGEGLAPPMPALFYYFFANFDKSRIYLLQFGKRYAIILPSIL